MIDRPQLGRRRSEVVRRAVLDATFAVLEEDGFERLSIEGIAARAGVAKTTIYRWWTGKGLLAVEAFLDAVAPSIAFPGTGSAKADMVEQVRLLAEIYRGRTGHLVREMIASSQSDPGMRRAFVDGFLKPRRDAACAVFRRGQAQGEFRDDLDPEVAIDGIYGGIYYRLLVSGDPLDDAFIAQLSNSVFRGVLTD